MANKSIYGCKTRSRPFRIPEDHYEEIVGKFNKILAKYQLKEHIRGNIGIDGTGKCKRT